MTKVIIPWSIKILNFEASISTSLAMEITPELKEKLSLLHEKYAALGEDFNAYLEGLLYADVQ